MKNTLRALLLVIALTSCAAPETLLEASDHSSEVEESEAEKPGRQRHIGLIEAAGIEVAGTTNGDYDLIASCGYGIRVDLKLGIDAKNQYKNVKTADDFYFQYGDKTDNREIIIPVDGFDKFVCEVLKVSSE